MLFAWPVVHAQDADLEASIEALQQTVSKQQAELDAQREQLAKQLDLIRQLQAAMSSTAVTTGGEAASDPVAAGHAGQPDAGESDGQQAARAELTRRQIRGTADKPVNSQATLYDPSTSVFDPNFPGAWHLPGTTGAMKIGGYVNLALVHSLDPLLADDRFIVGSIPPNGVNVPGAREGTQVTASQSRLNLEIREQTTNGQLRAFVEGDFLGDGDSFRLRHAYGQYGWALAGKTWSVFSNLASLPEQVDFEGINGAVLVRQAQLRFFPTLGEKYSMVVSVEDPRTDIENGTGEEGIGDLVLSVDRLPLGGTRAWNYKVGIILRDLKGQSEALQADRTTGWGLTTSGRISPRHLAENDSILWQVTYGEGIGRYLNDLGTVGGGDAVFDATGNLQALPVFAGFLSYQHEWTRRFSIVRNWQGLLRSNLNFSWIDVDNYDFQSDESYASTLYASANLIYFPTQNARVGIEFLWGRRTNKDGSSGSASQVQLSSRFTF